MSDIKKTEFASGFGLTFRSNFLTFKISFKKALRDEAMSRKLRLRTVNAQLARESPMGKNVEKVHEASTNKNVKTDDALTF